jgi:hypothetical protein
MMRHMPVRAALAGVLLLASFVYLRDLDRVPVYIGWDEARFCASGTFNRNDRPRLERTPDSTLFP